MKHGYGIKNQIDPIPPVIDWSEQMLHCERTEIVDGLNRHRHDLKCRLL
jgi:hypothetical protein